MFKTIISAATAYISTSLDYLLILMVIFARRKQFWPIYLGDIVGTSVLVMISLILAFFAGFIPQTWALGFLGLIPIGLGIWGFIHEEDEPDVDSQVGKHSSIIWEVALITISTCGADNIGVYVPFFAPMDPATIYLTLFVFFIMMTLFCWLASRLGRLPGLANVLDRYGATLTSVLYILIGLYVLWDAGTIQHFLA
ncbi:cadmium resistance transporter [Lacticaseibacillus brantae]|uniref:Cadmium binding protein n=1 Tax=Lacticaseibacillus brantae DSM 23927 TaxID=1423727 RepID=A0A0R2B9E1_9LACO|nr:cadmium resistance transporter [Lacticaseibacillus brantae]KRM72211.1 cadmium binding protein [Lacticaseibacillus brantae DSM 23927]